MHINSVIANNISVVLKEKNLTQSDLSRCLNLSEETVCKMLSGQNMITAPDLVKISELTKTPVHDLIQRSDSVLARKDLDLIDELTDLIIYYKNIAENYEHGCSVWTRDELQNL